jgi:beta-lactamase class A
MKRLLETRRAATLLFGLLLLACAVPAAADEAPEAEQMPVKDPIERQLEQLRGTPNREDRAPLWQWRDKDLEYRLERALDQMGLGSQVKRKRLGAVLVVIDEQGRAKVAGVNPDLCIYAASLPKIAILLTAFDRIESGELEFNRENENLMAQMIRRSSNTAATEMIRRVGIQNIAKTMLADRYRLYDPRHNGGLWVGKEYGKGGLWRRDPLHNLSHAATPMQIARYYYMLETGQLVSRVHSQNMKKLLSGTALSHKFAKSLLRMHPQAVIYRKSGSWRTFHSDSALVKTEGRTYIAAALMDDERGGQWLGEIVEAFDNFVFEN